MKTIKQYIIILFMGILPVTYLSAATVYLVLGSDTAIWEGMSVNRYHCTYNPSLYTDPHRNAYTVMDPAFRAPFVDSYGQTMKMTWWMMAGNIFRYATNTDVPVPNIMTLYLMQKYHGENALINGDEISLHYHTFTWTDYNEDGLYFWNQALDFNESRDDFDVTLAQFLLEEDVFPVSFRSGWHYMDNNWQHYLNDLMPYSMHNAWPANRVDLTEPLDNTYNWSESPSDFVPFQPSLENYQIPGDGPGWNVRSASFQQVIRDGLMDTVFAHASQGVDQLACFWAHLPEGDFPENMAAMDALAHAAEAKYPGVDFKYCTAVEAMQLWRETADTASPQISIEAKGSSDARTYTITSNEPLFQPAPFVSVKYKDESYQVIACDKVSDYEWNTQVIPHALELAKFGVAATDTAGNLTTEIINLIPDDIYIDNLDPGYTEYSGTWTTSSEAAWGVDSRYATVSSANPIHVGWTASIPSDGGYHVYYQVPEEMANDCMRNFLIHSLGGTDTIEFSGHPAANEWVYLGTPYLISGTNEILELYSVAPYPTGTATVATDVVKFSAAVRNKDMRMSTNLLDFGEVSLDQMTSGSIEIRNLGLSSLTIQNIMILSNQVSLGITTPLVLEKMESLELPINLNPTVLGTLMDTLIIVSDDPMHPSSELIITADVQYPFQIIDNEETSIYVENGTWFTSVAQAWGPTSRYAWLNSGASASFTLSPPSSALYDINEIVPTTVNATDNALYILKINDIATDSVYLNQNTGSGAWVTIGRYHLPADTPIHLEVHDPGNSTVGAVLRADAVKIQMVDVTGVDDESMSSQGPDEPRLHQNYPNPFNPSTSIRFSLPRAEQVRLTVYDMLGREVMTLIDSEKAAGHHELIWNGQDAHGAKVSTGVYLCRLQTGQHTQTIKMVYLR